VRTRGRARHGRIQRRIAAAAAAAAGGRRSVDGRPPAVGLTAAPDWTGLVRTGRARTSDVKAALSSGGVRGECYGPEGSSGGVC